MNVAVLIIGGPRNFETVYPSFIEKIINQNPDTRFDVFVSTWDITGMFKKDKDYKVPNTAEDLWINTNHKSDINTLIEIVNPVCIIVDNFTEWRNKNKSFIKEYADKYALSEYSRVNSAFTQFFQLRQCLNLIDDLSKYDAVIKYRFDLEILENLKIDSIKAEIDKGIVISDNHYAPIIMLRRLQNKYMGIIHYLLKPYYNNK
jgi:hypothetical protein